MSLFETASFNSTLYEALRLQIEDTLLFVRDLIGSCVSSFPIEKIPNSFVSFPEITYYEEIAEIFFFNEFQVLLLKTFGVILLFTIVLIIISWQVYGKRISERFMKPATSATIKQLKDSVSKLKLPKEHTPRI